MFALVLAIGAEGGWIIFDIVVSVVTYPLLPSKEWWALVIGGAVLVVLTIIARILEFRGDQRVERRNSEEHEALAKGSLAILQLASVTNTTGEPIVKTLEVANDKIAALESRIDRYESITWTPPSYAEKIDIANRLKSLGPHSVYIAHTGQQDCYEFAAELSDIIKNAGWSVAPIRPDADPKAHGTRSIDVVGKDENLDLVRSVSDALMGLTRQALSSTSALYAGRTDVLIKIGPRKMRSGEFL
jgi:hypothetical protein